MTFLEAHVERLLGRRVRDTDGRIVGRIEEMRAEIVDGETVIVEFYVGAGGLLERLGGFMLALPFFDRLPVRRQPYQIAWDQLDLSDPRQPRALIARSCIPRRPS